MPRYLVIAALGCLPLLAAAANADPSSDKDGRYTMSPVEGGVLRLDRNTGVMALCTRKNDKLICEPVEDRAAEIAGQLDKLETENRALKDRIKALEDATASDGTSKAPDAPDNKTQLPTEEEVDKALDYVERMFKKFRDRLQKIEPAPQKQEPGEGGAL